MRNTGFNHSFPVSKVWFENTRKKQNIKGGRKREKHQDIDIYRKKDTDTTVV